MRGNKPEVERPNGGDSRAKLCSKPPSSLLPPLQTLDTRRNTRRCFGQSLEVSLDASLPSLRLLAVNPVWLCELSHALIRGCRRHRFLRSLLPCPQHCQATRTSSYRSVRKPEMQRMLFMSNRSKMSRRGGIARGSRASSGHTRLPMS